MTNQQCSATVKHYANAQTVHVWPELMPSA